jgi:hypothetical protein
MKVLEEADSHGKLGKRFNTKHKEGELWASGGPYQPRRGGVRQLSA